MATAKKSSAKKAPAKKAPTKRVVAKKASSRKPVAATEAALKAAVAAAQAAAADAKRAAKAAAAAAKAAKAAHEAPAGSGAARTAEVFVSIAPVPGSGDISVQFAGGNSVLLSDLLDQNGVLRIDLCIDNLQGTEDKAALLAVLEPLVRYLQSNCQRLKSMGYCAQCSC